MGIPRIQDGAGIGLAVGLGLSLGCPGPAIEDPRPFNDIWRLELDAPFPYRSASGGRALIERLTIGGREENGNFANRGHVIVQFDPTPNADRIRIEMRRYAMAQSESEATQIFAALRLWAATGSLRADPAPEDLCTTTWQDDCQIRVLYDGVTQLARTGADLRVTLPASYRHLIDIHTEDNIAETSYLRRGEVCIEGLNGSADVELGSGRAFVIVDANTQPVPTCELLPGALEDCASFPAGAWSAECSCLSQGEAFGRVRVQGLDNAAFDAVVDVPGHLWTHVSMVNQGPGQLRGADPPCADASPAGDRCDACAALTGYVLDPYLGAEASRSPWINRGTALLPSPMASASGGYSVSLEAKTCGLVAYTPSPAEFLGLDAEGEQPSEERGNLTVCNDCLRGQRCDALLWNP